MFAEGIYLLVYNNASYRKKINRRLKVMDDKTDRESVLVQLRRERGLTSTGDYRLPLVALNRLLLQSGLSMKLRLLLASMAAAGLVAGLLAYRLLSHLPMSVAIALAVGIIIPVLALAFKRARRRRRFEEQLPEAIDVMVRSLRAGYPVPVAVTMVAREMSDPIGSEFGMASDEMTYGMDLEAAMSNMGLRAGSGFTDRQLGDFLRWLDDNVS